MNLPLRQHVLFTPARVATESAFDLHTQGRAAQRSQARLPGIAGLGAATNDVSNVLSTLHSGFMDLVGSVTGSKQQQQQRDDALKLAQLQAQAAQTKEQSLTQAAPWLAVGGVAVIGLIAFLS